MKITKLYTGQDNKSHFMNVETGVESEQPLGNYSRHFPVGVMQFRDFEKGLAFDWHTAPQEQYIIYIEGEVEVEASGGEKKTFRPGDVLLAADLEGEGHITRTLSRGRSIIVTADVVE